MSISSNEIIPSDVYPYAHYEQDKAATEQTLNVLEWIPFLSSPVGVIRVVYGTAQIITSIVKASLCLVSDLFIKSNLGFGFRTFKHSTYIIHGLGNVVRGALQMGVVGWLPFLIHDFVGIRYRYNVEEIGLRYNLRPTQFLEAY